jgi:hypothetical protein
MADSKKDFVSYLLKRFVDKSLDEASLANPGIVFTKLYFLHNLRIGSVS